MLAKNSLAPQLMLLAAISAIKHGWERIIHR